MSSRHTTQWKTRNTLYLRISANAVLQMVLYLDPTHTGWMSELVLERVLETLRDRIRLKLLKESKAAKGKGTVDVYRGAGWQMAYYFRRTAQKHAVLLKDKQIVMEQPEGAPARPQGGVTDVDAIQTDEVNGGSAHDPLLVDDEDEKHMKPKLKVSYAGFAIFGRTLVVVVEPYPRLTAEQLRATSVAPVSNQVRELSHAPSRRDRSESFTAPLPPAKRRRESEVPLFRADTPASTAGGDDEEDDDIAMTGFRARSQSIARTFGLDADEDEEEVQVVEDRARSASVMSLHGAPNQLSLDQFTTASPTPPPL